MPLFEIAIVREFKVALSLCRAWTSARPLRIDHLLPKANAVKCECTSVLAFNSYCCRPT